MSTWSPQAIRYVGLRQPTSSPSVCAPTPAAPDAESTLARNSVWPSAASFSVVAVPMDGRPAQPGSNPQMDDVRTSYITVPGY